MLRSDFHRDMQSVDISEDFVISVTHSVYAQLKNCEFCGEVVYIVLQNASHRNCRVVKLCIT